MSCLPWSRSRLESVSATNQRGQPAFFGMTKRVSLSSSGRCRALPVGSIRCRALSPAWLTAPREPVTTSASSAGSYALSAALYAVVKAFSASAASAFVAAGTTSRSPCTVTHPLAVRPSTVATASPVTGRTGFRLLIRCFPRLLIRRH